MMHRRRALVGRLGIGLVVPVITSAAVPALALPNQASEHAVGRDSSTRPVEVEVDSGIPDAEALETWIRDSLAASPAPSSSAAGRSTALRVTVTGALYDYHVSITAMRNDAHEDIAAWACECTNDDLLGRIDAEIQAAASRLDASERPTAVDPLPTGSAEPTSDSGVVAPRWRWKRDLGIGLTIGGSFGSFAGVVLIGVGRNGPIAPDVDDPTLGLRKNYRVPGVPTLVTGLALLGSGVVLLVLDRRDAMNRGLARGVVPAPSVASGGVGLQLAGRF